jgi:hypothetical protein
MKIKCLYNTGKILPKDVYKDNGYGEETEFQVIVNKEYNVYAITSIKKHNWFLICDENYDERNIYYPLYLPSNLFTITDGKISKCWIAGEGMDEYDTNEKIIQFGFRELIEDGYFYGKLVEGYQREIKIFQDYKKLIDEESTSFDNSTFRSKPG